MDLTLQSRGDVNHLPLAIHQFQSSAVTIGEGASWPCQNRADSSLVYKAFSSPIRHVEGDLRLCWSGEDGSSGMWSWEEAGSRQMVCGQEPLIQTFTRGCPSGIPQEAAQDVPPSSARLSNRTHTASDQELPDGLSSLFSPPNSPRGGR